MSDSDPEILKRPALHPVATILRGRGFVPLPRLWVRSEDMPTIHMIAGRYREEVNSVRAQVGQEIAEAHEAATRKPDPKEDRDAAWEAMDRLRASA